MSQVRKRAKRRKRTPAREEFFSYLVQVSRWDYYYAFRPGDPKSRWDDGAFSELATLRFIGGLIRPEGSQYTTVEVTLSARSNMMDEPLTHAATSIGSFSASGSELSAYIFVPAERMAELATVAQSNRIQIIHITSTKLRYRSALIQSVSLDTKFNEEDW